MLLCLRNADLGEFFTFDQGLKRESGEDGFADVWRKNCFAWEYKGRHKDLAICLMLVLVLIGSDPTAF